MVWAPLQYRAPFCVGTMGAGHFHFGQFEFMEVTEGKPYNRASSVGRFIGRSFCVQAKDKLRPTWRPSAGSPQQKCTPSAAFGGVSPRRGKFWRRYALWYLWGNRCCAVLFCPLNRGGKRTKFVGSH